MAVMRTIREQTVINNENIKTVREGLHEKIADSVIAFEDKLTKATS